MSLWGKWDRRIMGGGKFTGEKISLDCSELQLKCFYLLLCLVDNTPPHCPFHGLNIGWSPLTGIPQWACGIRLLLFGSPQAFDPAGRQEWGRGSYHRVGIEGRVMVGSSGQGGRRICGRARNLLLRRVHHHHHFRGMVSARDRQL